MICVLFLSVLESCTVFRHINKGQIQTAEDVEYVEFDYEHSLMYVEVNVDGHDWRFIIDTGAPTVVDPKVRDAAGLKQVYSTKMGDVSGKSEQMDIVAIDKFEFGGITIKNTAAAVGDFSHFSCFAIDGILGANIISLFDWEIDYQKGQAKLYRNGIPESELAGYGGPVTLSYSKQKTPYVRNGQFRLDTLVINSLLIDTGSSGPVNMKSNEYVTSSEQEGYRWSYGESSRGMHGPVIDTARAFTSTKVKIGPVDVPAMSISERPREKWSVGNSFFEHFNVIFSWSRDEMYLKPSGIDLEPPRLEKANLRYQDGVVVVQRMAMHCKLLDHDVEFGDKVLKVGDTDLRGISEEEFCGMKEEWSTETLVIERAETSEILTVNMVDIGQ